MPPTDPDAKIPCPTAQHLQAELDALAAVLTLGEREDTWEKMERGIVRFAGVTRGGGYKHLPLYIEGLGRKGVGMGVAACMLSDRGRLSGVAIELLQTLAPRLAISFAPLVTLYLEPLVKLLGRPNKVFLKRAEKCLLTIIAHCHLPSILPELRRGLSDEAATCRRGCAIGVERALREWSKAVIGEKGVVVIEEAVKKMATDKDPEVRATGKRVWARFRDIWQERIEDFSAPLTPTIRRYLDILENGAAAKPKAAVRPAPPVHRPVPSASSASSLSAPVPPPAKTQQPRLAALGGKPARPQPPTFSESIREKEADHTPLAGPSRRQASPRKVTEPLFSRSRAQDPTYPESWTLCPPAKPPLREREREAETSSVLSRHGRSISHNALPTASSYTSLPSATDTWHNPLTNPSRPTLASSASSVSLPTDSTDAPGPLRRFPPPARIVRPPLPSTEEDGDNQHIYTTPGGPLRGAVRPPPGQVALSKRPLGAAKRRVVTAPIPVSSDTNPSNILTGPAPGPIRPLGKGIKERIEKLEKAASPSRVEPSDIPLPASPTVKSMQQMFLGSPAPERAEVVHSPLMPVLATSTTGQAEERADEWNDDPLHVQMNETMKVRPGTSQRVLQESADTAGAVSVQEQQDDKRHAEDPVKAEDGVEQMSAPAEEPAIEAAATKELLLHIAERHMSEEAIALTERPESDGKPFDAPALFDPHESVPTPEVEAESTDAPGVDNLASVASVMPALTNSEAVQTTVASTAPAPSKAHAKPAKAAEPPAQASSGRANKPPADVKLPSVTARRTANQILSASERRPFKPTSQAAKASGSTATASTASTAARAAAAVKPVVKIAPETIVAKTAPIPKAIAPAGPPLSAISTDPKPLVKTTSSFAARTKASASRVASTVQPKKVPVPVALPPVRKEKVKLKPALPKFVPTRAGARTVSNKDKYTSKVADKSKPQSLASSTSTIARSVAGIKGHRGVGVVTKAKVQPEMVPLPLSPGEKAKLPHEIPLPRSPTSGKSAGHAVGMVVTAEVRPEAIALPESPVKAKEIVVPAEVPLPVSPVTISSAKSRSAHSSPITLSAPRAVSPVLTTSPAELPTPPPASPVMSAPTTFLLPSTSSSPRQQPLNGLGLPTAPADDKWASVSARTTLSKASTVPAMSDSEVNVVDEGVDEEEEDDEAVTFKSRNKGEQWSNGKVIQPKMREEMSEDLIVFSQPARRVHGEGAQKVENWEEESEVVEKAGGKGKRSTTPRSTPPRERVLRVKDTNTPRRGGEEELVLGL